MNPVTCAAFILSSASLGLLQSSNVRNVRFAQVCAAIVALIGLIKMCAIIGLLDVGIDRLFFPNSLYDSVTQQQNQMAPNTAVNFLLFGMALLLLKIKTTRANFFPAQIPTVVIILSSFLAIIGYLYGAKTFYVLVSFNPMAIHTAISFLLLGIGLLLCKPDLGIAGEILNPETGGAMARRLFPLVILIPGILGWLRLYGERREFYGTQLGTALLIIAIVILLGTFVLSNARSMNIAASKRKKIEEELSASKILLTKFVTHTPVAVAMFDTEMHYLQVSEQWLADYHLVDQNIIGKVHYEVMPDVPERWKEIHQRCLAGAVESCKADSYVRSDGMIDWLEWEIRPWHKSHGEIGGIILFTQVITERKKAELLLKNSEEFNRSIFENSPDCVKILELDGTLHSMNSNGLCIMEIDDFTPFIGEHWVNFWEGNDLEKARGAVESARSGKRANFEGYCKTAKGTLKYWDVSVAPIFDAEGKPTRLISTSRDITERKRIENERKRIEAELEIARDAALESVRMKSEFLANMSHEIRTPMNGVIGMTGLLLHSNLNLEQSDYAHTVQTSAESLLRIIDDILDFSKIDAGHLSFENIEFDLRECVESTVELLAEKAQTKGIEIASLVYEEVPLQLYGDPGRLRQILTNLVGNAIKFTDFGEVTLKVHKQSDENNYVSLCFEVIDTGIGIAEEAQQRLFRAFTQADGSTTRKYGGTGLGLAISKQLVEMMNGEIGIKSVPGSGSTFWFTARFEKQLNQIPEVPCLSDVSLEGVGILIVDDNATNRRIFVHQTASWGMKPTEAESGAQALEMLQTAAKSGKPYKIAILDLMMPGMDGFELARTIKSEPMISKTLLVLLPSYGKRGDGQTARESGIAAFIQKPVRQSKLYDCLINVISDLPINHRNGSPSPRLITQHSLRTSNQLPQSKPISVNSKYRILIAEDNLVNQKVALSQLKNLGYAADVVKNGQEAVDAVRRIPYDLVLMDCQMPEMDGFEATAEIRRSEGAMTHTTVIAMTAHALEGEREKCIACGMDDYISKPVKLETLQEMMQRWLDPSSLELDGAEAKNISLNG